MSTYVILCLLMSNPGDKPYFQTKDTNFLSGIKKIFNAKRYLFLPLFT